MVMTLDDTKRVAIAEKLADMRDIQNLLISNDQVLLNDCSDNEILQRFQDMLADDRKNLGILETVLIQYGVSAKSSDTVQKMVSEIQKMMSGSELTLYEKASQQELLKHKQAMNGILVHKAAQVVGADIEAAITPLNTVNFENRAHQEQLKGVLEVLGVYELTGKEAKQGIWARVQDTVAALSGVAGSAISRTDDEIDIRNLIRMDHQKVSLLFKQIESTDDMQKAREYFGQLFKDLSAHAEAEEQVVYPAVRSFYGTEDTQELYDEQAEMKVVLEALRSTAPNSSEFKAEIRRLKTAVEDHVRQEESTMFAAIRDNCSDEQQKQMATQFKAAKKKLQEQMAAENN